MSEAMNIRNRQPDIKKICTNALQDFLKIVIKSDWKNDFFQICEKNCPGDYDDIYLEAYETILRHGLENYEITQMDITLIYAILKYNKNLLIYKPSTITVESLKFLKGSRNVDSHSSTNEEDEELYLEALIYLCKLQTFVKSVNRDYKIPKSEEKIKFFQKYMKSISELMFKIDDERFELVAKYKQFQKDVDQILNARNEKKHEVYRNICESYSAKSRTDESNRYLMNEFNAYAYERGIDEAVDGAIVYYVYVKDFKKINSTYKSIFYKIPKNDTSALVKEINDYLILVCLVRREVKEPLDESFDECFEFIKKLGFTLIKNEKGDYTLLENNNKAQSSDK